MPRTLLSICLLGISLLSLAGCGADALVSRTIDLIPRLERATFTSNEFDPADPAQRPLATQGWFAGVAPTTRDGWLQASAKRSTIQLPASQVDFAKLALHVRPPPYLPYAFELAVQLNGVELGRHLVADGGQELVLDIPSNTLRVGLNQVVLTSSHLLSARDCKAGKSTWPEGVHVDWLRLQEPQRESPALSTGQALTLRIPAEGKLRIRPKVARQRLVLQDKESAQIIVDQLVTGAAEFDLKQQAGREVTMTLFSEAPQAVAPAGFAIETSSAMPNLVLIIVDTLRYDALSEERTPKIFSLAADGVTFKKSFSHAPMTLPSHTALFTSRYPHQTGIVTNGQVVPESLPLLSEWLHQLGYETMATASLATLWQFRAKEGLDQGFRDFRHVERDYSHGRDTAKLLSKQLEARGGASENPLFLFAHLADPHEPYRSFGAPEESLVISLNGVALATANPKRAPHIRATSDLLAAGEHTIALQSDGEPFVMRSLYVHTSDGQVESAVKVDMVLGKRLETQHSLEATFTLERASQVRIETWVCDHPDQKQSAERYFQEVEQADRAVGEILQTLKDKGLYDSSLIIFTSDHGEAFGEHQFNGHSHNLFDELLHVPTIFKLPQGKRYESAQRALRAQANALVRHIDFTPTALKILGVPALPDAIGASLLLGDDDARVLVAETHKPEAARDQYCMRDTTFKLIYYPDKDDFLMFQVEADPLELADVYKEMGKERTAWQLELRQVAKDWEQRAVVGSGEGPLADIEALGY